MCEAWITGVGVVGPHGLGIGELMSSAAADRSAFTAWPSDQNPPTESALIGTVPGYPKERFFTERQLRLIDRPMTMSVCAVGLALDDAGFADDLDRDNVATFLSTTRSEHASVVRFITPLMMGKPRSLNPAQFPMIARNIFCGQVAITFGFRGPSTVLASGSNAPLEAVCRAFEFIRRGRSKVAVVGAVEVLSKFALFMSRALYREHLHAPKPAFFGRGPGLLVPSEGSCMLVLEDADHARARNATPYARIDGYYAGRSGQARRTRSLLDAWSKLFARVNADPAAVGLFCLSSGGSNRLHEAAETNALGEYYTRYRSTAAACAPRAFAGEGESWTGALQVGLAAAIVRESIVPPMRNVADDKPGVIPVTAEPVRLTGRTAVVSSMDRSGAYSVMHLSGC